MCYDKRSCLQSLCLFGKIATENIDFNITNLNKGQYIASKPAQDGGDGTGQVSTLKKLYLMQKGIKSLGDSYLSTVCD